MQKPSGPGSQSELSPRTVPEPSVTPGSVDSTTNQWPIVFLPALKFDGGVVVERHLAAVALDELVADEQDPVRADLFTGSPEVGHGGAIGEGAARFDDRAGHVVGVDDEVVAVAERRSQAGPPAITAATAAIDARAGRMMGVICMPFA